MGRSGLSVRGKIVPLPVAHYGTRKARDMLVI